jgi:hypothetical protein
MPIKPNFVFTPLVSSFVIFKTSASSMKKQSCEKWKKNLLRKKSLERYDSRDSVLVFFALNENTVPTT